MAIGVFLDLPRHWPQTVKTLIMRAEATLICRVFSLGFWSQAFAELKARSGSSFVGVVVLAVETVAVVLAVELLAAASPKGRNKKD